MYVIMYDILPLHKYIQTLLFRRFLFLILSVRDRVNTFTNT